MANEEGMDKDWGPAFTAAPVTGEKNEQQSPRRSRLGLIAGAVCVSSLALAAGFIWGDANGRAAQHNHDTRAFAADQQRLANQVQQDEDKLQAALKLGRAGISSVTGIHFGQDNKLYATVGTAKPGTPGACYEDFLYATDKNGNPILNLKLPDATGQHVFADIVINGPNTDSEAVKIIKDLHPNGCRS